MVMLNCNIDVMRVWALMDRRSQHVHFGKVSLGPRVLTNRGGRLKENEVWILMILLLAETWNQLLVVLDAEIWKQKLMSLDAGTYEQELVLLDIWNSWNMTQQVDGWKQIYM